MDMTRKDYELLAAVFSRYTWADNRHIEHMKETDFEPSDTDRARSSRTRLIIKSIADALENDNPRFNRETFYKASGL
jgi:hypothetical protein